MCLFHRTTSNIAFDDINEIDGCSTFTISDDEMNETNKENMAPVKRRRSSSTGDQMKLFETFAKSLKDNHSQKMCMLQNAMETTKPQTELELYFSSICKTVEKLHPIEQSKIKMQISNIVNQAELAQLQSSQPNLNYYPHNYENRNGEFAQFQSSQPNFSQFNSPNESQDTLVSTVCNLTSL